ncbi:MAG: serine/threonine protein kinase [Deltaproteobacteria bacterium]|nr:serine/threonine protein kinase [Deltaproteobacteria bacterium]
MYPVVRPSDAPKPTGDARLGGAVTVRCATSGRNVDLRVETIVGTGGMARVYAASDRDGRKVALKLLDREIGGDERVRARFLQEKDLADRIVHPARVPIELAGSTGEGDAALLLELVEGENLEAVRRRLGGKLPLVPSLRIGEEVLDFLEACHERGVLHRDVKTANILWSPGRPIRMVDFGIARCDEIGAAPELMLGTPSFMAPEQVAGLVEEDVRLDVFGVGAVLFTILTGKRLHRGRTHDESLFLAATQAAPKLEAEGVPADVAALVDRALAFQREDRWPDVRSMRAALRALRLREEARLTAPPLPDDATDDGLADATPLISSGTIVASGRPPDARGTFLETPLPHLLVHVLARELDGALVVSHGDAREIVEFLAGSPVRRSAAASDDPMLGPLARIARMPAEVTYRFYIDDRLRETLGASWTRVEPLDAILTSTRRLRGQPAFRTRMRASLERLGDRPITLHPAAAPARFGLSSVERQALDAAVEFELSFGQLLEAAVAPRDVVEPLLYALGITRHLAGGSIDAWPVGVPRP